MREFVFLFYDKFFCLISEWYRYFYCLKRRAVGTNPQLGVLSNKNSGTTLKSYKKIIVKQEYEFTNQNFPASQDSPGYLNVL